MSYFCKNKSIVVAIYWAIMWNGAALAYNPGIDWDAEILKAEIKSTALWDRSRDMEHITLGSMYGTSRVEEHKCSILGRILDRSHLVEHLSKPEPLNSPSAYDYLLASHNLSQWIYVAQQLRNASKDYRIRSWNFECVGNFNIPITAALPEKNKSALYEIDNGGLTLLIYGDITDGYHDRLIEVLDKHPSVTTIGLASGGGNVSEAIKAGIEIRRRRLNTTLFEDCFSACPLVYLGGTKRTIWAPYPRLGFHQVREKTGETISQNDPVYIGISQYAETMGANSRAILTFMFAAKPEEMYLVEYDYLCSSGLATWVQRICGF